VRLFGQRAIQRRVATQSPKPSLTRRRAISLPSNPRSHTRECRHYIWFRLSAPREVSSMSNGPAFDRYIGIDYSGAETPASSLRGIRAYCASRTTLASEVRPPAGPRKYWSRRGLAEWLAELLSEETATLVGIDHGFSFPLRYFEEYGLSLNWTVFLEDFQKHWPTDDEVYVDFVREGVCGNSSARRGKATWRRVTEIRARGAKSVFTLTCRARWRSQPTADFPGCGISDCGRADGFISGPSTGGEFRLADLRSWKCTQLYGTARSHRKAGTDINTTLTPSPNGCAVRTLMARSLCA
jgi:hypothetical protein